MFPAGPCLLCRAAQGRCVPPLCRCELPGVYFWGSAPKRPRLAYPGVKLCPSEYPGAPNLPADLAPFGERMNSLSRHAQVFGSLSG